ncbi:SURF1 family protein [Pseudoduganella sp. RAF53_2]|uniref:SURF1 family protein n=1 Tax=unclassified Pseudoduganella TaxID=2637179 RepID=UPI003F983038
MRIAFRFKLIPFLAMLVLVAIGISAARWQTGRAEQKEALAARLSAGVAAEAVELSAEPVRAEEIEFRRVRVTGEWLPNWPLYLDNRPYQGRAGFYLLMPLKLAGSNMHVLVVRGWLPRDAADRNKLPEVSTPSGTVTIEGVAHQNAGHVMELGSVKLAPRAIVQNADAAGVAAATGLAFQPVMLEQTSADAGAAGQGAQLVRDWPAPSLGIEKHRGYAFQWYALAVMAFLFFVFTGFKKSGQQ